MLTTKEFLDRDKTLHYLQRSCNELLDCNYDYTNKQRAEVCAAWAMADKAREHLRWEYVLGSLGYSNSEIDEFLENL